MTHLVGLDLGFSERRKTNAFAIFRDGDLILPELMSPSERDAALRELAGVDVIAIDAPIVPADTPETLPRECERAFCRGPFQKRCKPGMSHVAGTGRQLRAHGRRAADHAIGSAGRIIEAFPNAFLGVALPDEVFTNPPKLRRGGKFDWLYDRWIEHGLFGKVVAAAQMPAAVAARCEAEHDHDRRAALVCLLTAAFAIGNDCVAVGGPLDGYFYLPPSELWAPWALAPFTLPQHPSG